MRLLSPDVATTTLDHEPLPAEEVEVGSPTAAVLTLDTVGGVEVGLWEMTEGTARDTEVDEVFVVLSGAATVSFEDGESVELRPGSVVRLRSGEHTTWVVHETLRKIYVA